MPVLENFQKTFTRYLLTGDEEGIDQILTAPKGPGLLTARDLAAIYRNNVKLSLREALMKTYPATLALVGEEFFAFAANQFISLHPPKAPVLTQYGAEFSKFIGTLEGLAVYPYVPDVAALEWAFNVAATVDQGSPIGASEFENAIAGDSLIALSPAVTLLDSAYAVNDIRRYALGEITKTPSVHSAEVKFLVVYPTGEGIEFYLVSKVTFEILSQVQAGDNFSAVLTKPFDPALYETIIREIGQLFAKGIFIKPFFGGN